MARLRGVAHDLLATFVSRNNDADGYWALGVLFRDAPAFRFDLVAGTVDPASRAAEEALSRTRAALRALLASYDVAAERVRAAELTIRFAAVRGEPFIARVELIDDRGRVIRTEHRGYCTPHDPSRESRRA